MRRINCFIAKPSTRVERFLRRYEDGECQFRSYHNIQKFYDEIEVPLFEGEHETDERMVSRPPDEKLKPLFPDKCSCGHVFSSEATYQLFTERLYHNEESGFYYPLRELPVGAMYFAPWYDGIYQPQLEHVLIVKTPGGDWIIDSQASNCTMPEDHHQKEHHCWVIEGSLPNITVSKNGKTCGAGGGSILLDKYHGFLRNGFLED